MVTPWLMGKISAPSSGRREIPAGGVLGAPSHGIPKCWGPSPEAGEQLSRRREGSGPVPTSAEANCNLSREVLLLEEGL